VGNRISAGPTSAFLWQGLWHPARKVRQVYWRHYNNLYIGAQDALVAFLPRLRDDGPNNSYPRHELDMMI
jgi:splicing factor 3B subunit 1